MRASTILVVWASVASVAAMSSACSSDPEQKSPAVETEPTDGAFDASSASVFDAAVTDDVTDAPSSPQLPDAGPVVEQVAANFGTYAYKFETITVAEVGAGGMMAISANEGVTNGAAVELVFDPKTGTTTCASASDAKVAFTSSVEAYQAYQSTGDCTIEVTRFGNVGDTIDGTFKANMRRGDNNGLYASGKFHVLRKK